MSATQIDGVFYINLDFRIDRQENMARQLKNCKWPVSRISAVRLENGPQEAGIKLQPQLAERIHVASIWLSHKVAIENAIEAGQSGASILLEDDVRVADSFWSDELNLPDSLPEDWEIIFYSPRYRVNKNGPLKDYKGKKWMDAPHGDKPVLLKKLRGTYIMTGAHFVVFKNRTVMGSVLDKMIATEEVYDVDRFYMAEFNTYGIDSKLIGTGPFGSDHD